MSFLICVFVVLSLQAQLVSIFLKVIRASSRVLLRSTPLTPSPFSLSLSLSLSLSRLLSRLPSFSKSYLPLPHDHSKSLQLLFSVYLSLSCNRTFSESSLTSSLSFTCLFRFSSFALPPPILVIPSYSLSSSSLPYQPSLSFYISLFRFLLQFLFLFSKLSLTISLLTIIPFPLLRFHFHLRILPLLNSFLPFSLILFHSLPIPMCSPMLLLSN